MALALAVISCLASGYLLVALGWARRRVSCDEALLRASLSVGFGLGTFSVIFFLALVLGWSHLLTIDILVLVLLSAALLLQRARSRSADIQVVAMENLEFPRWLHVALKAAFGIAVAAASYSAVLGAITHPHGEGWDAFAIWNLHARFLFRGGEHWCDGFSPLIPWSHPDYPLLVPSAIAHFWSVLGRETTTVPAVIGLGFTFCTLGVLFSALAILRGRTIAMLGTLALASTPFFIEQGSAQYADVPLSFFFLAVIVLLNLRHAYDRQNPRVQGFLALAGIASGFAIWTKNEGMLFLCAAVAAQVFAPSPQWTRRLAIFLGAVAPFFLLVTWFKHRVAFSSELFSNQPAMLPKIFDPRRYWVIGQWFAKDFLRFGGWWLVPGTMVLVVFYFLLAGKQETRSNPTFRSSLWALGLTLMGYFAIYVITPHDLYWHLRFSLNRLFLQLWPGTIFLFFLAIPRKSGQRISN